MRKIALTVFCLCLAMFAVGQDLALNNTTAKPEPAADPGSAVFMWTSSVHDFGKIKAGIPVTHEFTFTNTGEIPLVITTVQASCGCTVASYSKDPIEPGGTGFVKATYNAAKPGQFLKTVTVNANTDDGVVQLTFKGEVVE